jgi:hypothetical protein
MPTIERPIELSEQSLALIAAKKLIPGFSHTNWSDADLLPVRQEIRNYYRDAQRLACVYCRNPVGAVSAVGAQIEHIVSKASYVQFMFLPQNLCLICPDCNQCKLDDEALGIVHDPLTRHRVRYPTSSNAFNIVHPHFDNYEEHIIKAGRIYVERTDKGHWTIGACKLNRFTRRFGVSQELIDDAKSIELEERFHDSHSSAEGISNVTADIKNL